MKKGDWKAGENAIHAAAAETAPRERSAAVGEIKFPAAATAAAATTYHAKGPQRWPDQIAETAASIAAASKAKLHSKSDTTGAIAQFRKEREVLWHQLAVQHEQRRLIWRRCNPSTRSWRRCSILPCGKVAPMKTKGCNRESDERKAAERAHRAKRVARPRAAAQRRNGDGRARLNPSIAA